MYPTIADYQNRPPHPDRQSGGQRLRGFSSSNQEQPLLTVITVVRNGEKTLERTIQSVLSQTYPAIEYIIVDGASTDQTLEIIRRYDDRLAYWLSEPDGGLYDAMNKGIALASGEWIHLLNADDRYYNDSVLAQILSHLHPQKTNYFSMMIESETGTQRLWSFPFQYWKLYLSAYLPHPTLLVSRTQYEQIGLYDTSLKIAADHDLIMRLLHHFPANFQDIVISIMKAGGLSGQNIIQGFSEFRDVSARHGIPSWLAQAIFILKLKWLNWRHQVFE